MVDSGKSILICDDSLLIRSQLRDYVSSLGKDISILEAPNGNTAVELFEKNRPQLVFLDIVMPNGGGIECLKAIKEIDPNVTVVMISSSGTKQILKEALEAGAADFIQKPWNETLISQIINRIFG
ncbi:MAG: response regulator [Candidatus Saccharibacteria bacterium]